MRRSLKDSVKRMGTVEFIGTSLTAIVIVGLLGSLAITSIVMLMRRGWRDTLLVGVVGAAVFCLSKIYDRVVK